MLPCIGSARLLLAEGEGREPGREGFVQYVVEQLRKFPRAATLRVLHLEIGAWYDDLADAILDDRVCERVDQVVDLVVIQPGDAPGRPTNWRVICGMIAFAFPHLRSLALLMNVPPTLFVIRSLHRLAHLVDLRIHCVVPPASGVDPAVPPALGRITQLRCLSLLQASHLISAFPCLPTPAIVLHCLPCLPLPAAICHSSRLPPPLLPLPLPLPQPLTLPQPLPLPCSVCQQASVPSHCFPLPATGHCLFLTSYASVCLQASDFVHCMPCMGGLTNLERLHMYSEIPGGIR